MRRFATRARHILFALSFVSVAAFGLVGCGATEGDSVAEPGDNLGGEGDNATGIGQSGAQDFGRFRGLIESREVPSPDTLDPVGFFNEHKFDLPEPDCGEDVCLHGMFGVQGNMINGSNCTTVAIGFNTRRSPESFKRPPLNLAIAVDTGESMGGRPIEAVKTGLRRMSDELRPEDRVTLITYNSEARIVHESPPRNEDGERGDFMNSVDSLSAGGGSNLYQGLSKAFDVVDERASDDLQNRVIFLSDGQATDGIERRERIINLAKTYTTERFSLTSIGVGQEFDLELMRELGRGGGSNFYFLEDPAAVEEVFTEEVQTFLVPLAEDVNIEFEGSEAYQFRAAYGTHRWSGDNRSAEIDIPGLFMAGRESDGDTGPGGGRRGGGGIILLELVPTTDEDVLSKYSAGHPVGQITMDYRDPESGDRVEQSVSLSNPLEPGAAPESGEFSTPTVEKAFVALNLYAGFRMATARAERGAAGAALDILEPLVDNVENWLDENPDTDIRADVELMKMLIDLILEREDEAPTRTGQQAEPWPQD